MNESQRDNEEIMPKDLREKTLEKKISSKSESEVMRIYTFLLIK